MADYGSLAECDHFGQLAIPLAEFGVEIGAVTALRVEFAVDDGNRQIKLDHIEANQGQPQALAPEAPEGYVLAFEDEFDAALVDEAAWTYLEGPVRFSYASPDSVSLVDGKARIDVAPLDSPVQDRFFGGGGLISRELYKYGYFEVRVRFDAVYGWREDFGAQRAESQQEILAGDAPWLNTTRLEVWTLHHTDTGNPRSVSRWLRQRQDNGTVRDYGYVSRVDSGVDLTTGFHTVGWEFTPDYFNFTFEGQVVDTIDPEEFRDIEGYYLWFTSFAAGPNVTPSAGTVTEIEHVRVYTIDFDSPEYQERRELYTGVLGP
jgi:hypothetical protein